MHLLAILGRKPFRPFRIHISNGQVHEIRHPENVKVDLSIAWIFFPLKGTPILVEDRVVFVNLNHIIWGEFIEVPKPLTNGPPAT